MKVKHRGPNGNRNLLEIKKTSNGRRPQNIYSGISQQLLIGSSSNLKLKQIKKIVIKTALNGRRPQNIKSAILKPRGPYQNGRLL